MVRFFYHSLSLKFILQISQEELKKYFSEKGSVTDVRLIHKNGEFRRYAFIGFEGENDASTAQDYFHNTFIKQAKITVEMCHEFGSEQRPESWAEKNRKRKEKTTQQKDTSADNDTQIETKKEKKKKKGGKKVKTP